MSISTRQEIEEKIIARAWQDESFKQELLSNPRSAFEKEGINLPVGIDINVVEETGTTLQFVLPVKPVTQGELSDAELEAVSGGWYIHAGSGNAPEKSVEVEVEVEV